MSFKHKKSIDEIIKMDFDTYAKFLKKEIVRAAKLGELDVVISANHKFDDGKGKVSTLILMGAFVGKLASFFKENKAQPDFAKGKCFFETTKDGIKMHIAINAGKGKPDKIIKAGRKSWAKAGITPHFHPDKLPFLDDALKNVNVGETELVKAADIENNTQEIKLVKNNYLKARKALQDRVLPLISNKTKDSDYTNQHFKIAKVCLKNAASFLNKFKEVDEETQAPYQKDITTLHIEYPKLKRIAAKIKQALMATNTVDIKIDKTQNSTTQEVTGIKNALNTLDEEFKKLDSLKTQAEKALEYLSSQSTAL